MRYISLLAVVAVIGFGSYYFFNNFDRGSMQASGTDSAERIGVLDAIDSANEAAQMLEGKTGNVEQENSADTETESMVDASMEKDEPMTGTAKPVVENLPSSITMLVAGGCFWCVESDLEKLPGVIEVVSGYAEGTNENPTYQNYIKFGHREVAEVTFNPSVVSFEEILISNIKHTDPTDDDGSFFDRGDYYSTALYYENEREKQTIENLIKEIDEFGPYDVPLAIDVLERPKFWPAEDYHQDYYKGTLSGLKYKYYRNGSGRDDFIEKYWGDNTDPSLPWRVSATDNAESAWNNFSKPSDELLMSSLTDLQYRVTQKNATERSFTNEYWDNKEEGIYVDVVSGEPLFSSTDKFDSGTGWPSFTKPIEYDYVTEKADYKLIIKRTEVRSKIADSHLGHIFNDAPVELGGIRYCINSASLRFVPVDEMESGGYEDFLYLFS